MRNTKNDDYIFNILLMLILFYYTEGILLSSGDKLYKYSVILILLFSSFFTVKSLVMKKNNKSLVILWTLFISCNIISFLFSELDNPLYNGMIKNILLALLPFYPFYYMSYKNKLSNNQSSIFVGIFLIINILLFFHEKTRLYNNLATENVVINMAYSFVFLMPFAALVKNKFISLFLMLILFSFIVLSMKRGALVAGLLGFVVYLYFILSSVNKRFNLKQYLSVTSIVIIAVYFSYKIISVNEFLLRRIDKITEGSGRDEIYKSLINAYSSSNNIINLLFGFGFASSLEITKKSLGAEMYAHSDWIELLMNFGPLGVILYFALILSVFRLLLNRSIPSHYKIALSMVLVIWLASSIYSMVYVAPWTFLISIIVGISLGKCRNVLGINPNIRLIQNKKNPHQCYL